MREIGVEVCVRVVRYGLVSGEMQWLRADLVRKNTYDGDLDRRQAQCTYRISFGMLSTRLAGRRRCDDLKP